MHRDDRDDPTSPRISERTRGDSLNISDARHELENENENKNEKCTIDVCLEAKEPVDCGDCERVCSGSGYDFRRRHPGMVDRDDKNAKPTTETESEKRPNEELKERDFNNEIDARSIDEEPRFSFRDDTSVKSRSLSLTSTCSLSISVPTDLGT